MVVYFIRVQSLLRVILQARSDEIFCLIADFELLIWRKFDFKGLQNDSLLVDFVLVDAVSKRSFSIEKLVKDDTQRPYINFAGYLSIVFKCLWRQVPVCADTLWSEVNFGVFAFHFFAESKVEDFDTAIMEDDIGRFEVIVDDAIFLLEHVPEGERELPDDSAGLFFFQVASFWQVFWQLGTTAILKDEWDFVVDGDLIDELDDIGVVEGFESDYLALYMFDKLVDVFLGFGWFKAVNFDGDMVVFLEVIALVDFTKSTTS